MGAWRFGSIRRQVLMIKEVWVYFFEDFINSENMRVWLQGDHLEKSMTLNIKKAIEIKFQPLIKSRENFSLTLSRFCHQAQYFLKIFLPNFFDFSAQERIWSVVFGDKPKSSWENLPEIMKIFVVCLNLRQKGILKFSRERWDEFERKDW